MTSVVTYSCPSCGVMLEAENNPWQDWRQCPSCGRAGRPPFVRPQAQVYMEDVFYIGTFPETAPPYTPAPPTQREPANQLFPPYSPPSARSQPASPPAFSSSQGYPQFGSPLPTGYQPPSASPQRLVLGAGFFFAAVLTLISLVQHNAAQAGILAIVSVFLLILLARTSARG